MLTVGDDVAEVERQLVSGWLRCPECDGVLRRWGYARERWIRSLDGERRRIRPRRARCGTCPVSHVLSPVGTLLRRADAPVVVGSALMARAGGMGSGRIAAELDRPRETVRGWLRRFGSRLDGVRLEFTQLLRSVTADPVIPETVGDGWADTLIMITAAFQGVQERLGTLEARLWDWVGSTSSGRLLAPGWPTQSINTS